MHRLGDGCCYLDNYEVAPASFLPIGNRGEIAAQPCACQGLEC
jgi:hypothetical protein